MRGVCLFLFLWSSSQQTEIFDLISTADKFFEEFRWSEDGNFHVNDIKAMVMRTYELKEEHKLFKRSADDGWIRDKKGVYLLSDVVDVAKIPAKFPNDINPLSSHNVLFVATLEANGSNPEIQLANDMVLYQYSPMSGIEELGRVPVAGGIKMAIHSFQNVVYFITAEHEAKSDSHSFEGSTLYKLIEQHGRVMLEKVQILNVIEPNEVQFWEHQDEFYLAIGSNMGNDTVRTGTLIYRWMGHHFNCIQRIPSKFVKSLAPFSIGSFMYLAIANYQDEYGNTDIYSEIYQFHLDDLKFHPFQKIKTHGAQNFVHFKFEDGELKKSEHFLAVANYIGKNSNGALTSYLESVIYKFNGNIFVPFQSFKLLGATKWLPIQGSKGEFLILVAHSHGLRGYQYDGWRFSTVSLKFGQSTLGGNIQSIRTFQYFGDIFLTIADKSSFGDDVNLWKISFANKNELEEKYKEMESWCKEMEFELENDNFTETLNELNAIESVAVRGENLEMEEVEDDERHWIELLAEETRDLNVMLSDFEKGLENRHRLDGEIPIVMGSTNVPHVKINCETRNCVNFKNLEVLNLNGENFQDFLSNVVSIDEDFDDLNLSFDRVVVEGDLSSSFVNGHSSATLVDVSSETFINSELVVNGTVFINNDLNVLGSFDGVVPDEKHLLLYEGDQSIDDELVVNTLIVDNLKLSGIVNDHMIEDLLRHPALELKNNYQELKVNDLIVEGLVDGWNVTRIFENAIRKTGNQEIRGDLDVVTLEADEVIVESDEISNMTASEFFIWNPCLSRKPLADAYAEEDNSETVNSTRNPFERQQKSLKGEPAEEYVIVVEGLLKANDILDEISATSLSDIAENSYRLNDSIVDSFLEFSNVVVEEDFRASSINGIPIESWILKNSTRIQRVRGKKRFSDEIRILEKVNAVKINGIDWKSIAENVLNLNGEQEIAGDWIFDTITCHELAANSTNFGNQSFDKINRLVVKDSISAKFLIGDNLTVAGEIDQVSWANLIQDSVFDPNDSVEAVKFIGGELRVENLNLTGRINDFQFDKLVDLGSGNRQTIILDRDVALDNSLTVEELNFEGTINSILNPGFDREWLMQDESQTIRVPVEFENVQLKSGSILKNETNVNNVNLRKIFGRSIKINEDARIKHLYAFDKIVAGRIEIGGNVNGADFDKSVVRSKSIGRQKMSGNWFFENDLIIDGDLVIEGFVSGLNLSRLCRTNPSDRVNLVVGGSLRFAKEPKVVKVNGIDVAQKTKESWMKNENTTLRNSNLRFETVGFENETTLLGYLNGANLTLVSGLYLSKSLNRVVSGDYEFDELIIRKSCRMRRASVAGTVNGMNFTHWAKNVLLQGEDQIVEGRLRFNVFETSDLKTNGTINGFDLSKDVLRYDAEEAVVEGEKTFAGIRVVNLTLEKGKKVQGVDVDAWRENSVTGNGNVTFEGDLTLEKAEFLGSLKVSGMVNDIRFDSGHILKRTGNQVVKGSKQFNGTIEIRNLEVSGLVDGMDIDSLMKDQAYSNRDLVFTQPQNFTGGLSADSMEVHGLFQGVNVSEMCHEFFEPADVNAMKEEYRDLMETTKTLVEVVKGRAFFFDHFELIQTLKPNVKAVVPTLDNSQHQLAVFLQKLMTFMTWNEQSERFVNAGESLNLKDDVTFVTSEIGKENSLLYLETSDSVKIFTSDVLQEMEARDTSCVASFRLKSLDKSCIFIGQKRNSSRIVCRNSIAKDLRTYQWLESKGSVQATVLTVDDDVYLAVINKEEIFDKVENALTIYRFDSKLQHFHEGHTLAEVNPVAVSSITYKGNHYLVSAGGHLPESVHNSVISIFRLNKFHKVFVRLKSIQVDTPVDVRFALLPSSELALYVLTSNPTKPFVAYLHRGIAGFVEETSGLSLYPGSNLYSFTDFQNRHFVVISGFGRGQILKAGFKGDNQIN